MNLQLKQRGMNFSFEYMSPDQMEKNKTAARMQAMIKYSSGFDLSEIDLKLRGPGDIFGTKQSGFPELKFADIIKDSDLVLTAKKAAFKLIDEDPKLSSQTHQIIRKNLLLSYKESINYAKIG